MNKPLSPDVADGSLAGRKHLAAKGVNRTRPLLQWAVVLVSWSQRECASIAVRPGGEFADPSFESYQSDGWSTFVSSHHLSEVGAYRVTRTGRARKEFLLERAIYKTTDPSHHITSKLYITPPKPMDEGICGWNVFGAASDQSTMLREAGHRGVIGSHYLQDGLHADNFLRRQRARHRLYYEEDIYLGDPDARYKESQMDLVFGGRCKIHTGSNGIKWAMKPWSSE